MWTVMKTTKPEELQLHQVLGTVTTATATATRRLTRQKAKQRHSNKKENEGIAGPLPGTALDTVAN